MKNRKNYRKVKFFSNLKVKLIKNIMKLIYFFNVDKKSRIIQAVTRLENNSKLSKPIPRHFMLMPRYRIRQLEIILKSSFSLKYARFFIYINILKVLLNILNQF